MKKTTEILVPIDFSPSSANALRYALHFADKIRASIQVLHVVSVQVEGVDYPIMVSTATQQSLDIARERLKKFVETGIAAAGQILKEAPMISRVLEIGTPITTICEVARSEDTAIIIIGSRGENRSRTDKFLGSVAAGVVKNSKCAVMVIPEVAPVSDIDTMIYTTEIKDSDPFKIWKALELIKPFTPAVSVVHVHLKKDGSMEKHEKTEKMKSFFKERSPDLKIDFRRIIGDDVQKELNGFIEKNPADLMVMYQPPKGFWEQIFYKSTTKEMALHTKIPLLILKEED